MAKKVGNPNIGDTKNQGMTSVANIEDSIKAGNNNGRTVVGSGGPGFSAPSADTGKNFVQGHLTSVGGNLDSFGQKVNKTGVTLNDPAGAKYRTQVTYGYAPDVSDQAKLTQANGMVVPPAIDRGRSHGGFDTGQSEAAMTSKFVGSLPAPGWTPPNAGRTS